MKKLLTLICACLVLGLTVAACGDDDNGDSGDGAATTEQTTPAEQDTATDQAGGGAAAAERTVAVDIVDNDYEPREVTVAQGGTITWTNTGNAPHTVTKESGPGGDFDSETVAPGDTFEQTFDAAGTIGYVCTIHPGQAGTVEVQ
jgi:plastocyanin